MKVAGARAKDQVKKAEEAAKAVERKRKVDDAADKTKMAMASEMFLKVKTAVTTGRVTRAVAKDQGMDGSHIGPLECSLADCEMLLAALEELKDGNAAGLPQDTKNKKRHFGKGWRADEGDRVCEFLDQEMSR